MFKKSGIAIIEAIFCSCGQELKSSDKKCPKCNKVTLPTKASKNKDKKLDS